LVDKQTAAHIAHETFSGCQRK